MGSGPALYNLRIYAECLYSEMQGCYGANLTLTIPFQLSMSCACWFRSQECQVVEAELCCIDLVDLAWF